MKMKRKNIEKLKVDIVDLPIYLKQREGNESIKELTASCCAKTKDKKKRKMARQEPLAWRDSPVFNLNKIIIRPYIRNSRLVELNSYS